MTFHGFKPAKLELIIEETFQEDLNVRRNETRSLLGKHRFICASPISIPVKTTDKILEHCSKLEILQAS